MITRAPESRLHEPVGQAGRAAGLSAASALEDKEVAIIVQLLAPGVVLALNACVADQRVECPAPKSLLDGHEPGIVTYQVFDAR